MRLHTRSTVWGMALGSLAWMAHPTLADERDEIKAKVEAVRREAQELAKNGDFAGAQKLWEESKALMAASHERQNPESDTRRSRPAQAERLERVAQRLKHLRGAAEHLKAAEMHDMAMEMMRRADDMESDLVRAKEGLAREMSERSEAPASQEFPRELLERLHAQEHAYKQIEALERQHEAAQQQVQRKVYEQILDSTRRLQEENEQLRNEMRELRTMVERIAKELKRQRDL